MSEEIKKHPLNVEGKYYVDQDNCLEHSCCVDCASTNFKLDEKDYGAYVFKQPETPEEIDACEVAIMCCPVEAIHNDGK